MRTANTSPNFWSGVAASRYYFENASDYSLWACSLLEGGRDSNNIRILAGLYNEDNLFELRAWHKRALDDLGFANIDGRGSFIAHLRGYAEEFIEGKREFTDINQHFHELRWDTKDELLEPFDILHYGYWDFDYMDMSDVGVTSLEDFPRVTTEACHSLIAKIQAEQGRAHQSTTRSESKF